MPRLSKELQTRLKAIDLEISKDDALKEIIYSLMEGMTNEGGKSKEYIINWVYDHLPDLKKQVNVFRELD